MAERNDRGGVATNRVHRSLMSLTVGFHRKQAQKREQTDEFRMADTDEMFNLEMEGQAAPTPTWDEVAVEFSHHFYYAPLSRDAEFEFPHFTYGSRLISGGPVVLVANIVRWDVGEVDQVRGATIALGAFAPGAVELVRFRGEFHLTFAGFAAPVFYDTEE